MTASLQSVIVNQLRSERELADLRFRRPQQEASTECLQVSTYVEEDYERLRQESAVWDAQVTQLDLGVGDLLAFVKRDSMSLGVGAIHYLQFWPFPTSSLHMFYRCHLPQRAVNKSV